ncbi:hypothetical protein A8U91_00478 [Halomonas elongata]|uniref:Uncharacterized protein n=1 Tax=Halomonas elongata TaxID=2746 RepID=A0A1B8P1M4_HALEL|nr:hypothetical protein A8U91_00478 [Halomonas elongata]
MRQKRLKLEKLVKAEKDNLRLETQHSAKLAYDADIGSIEQRLEAACH